jgi:hypothetical protein
MPPKDRHNGCTLGLVKRQIRTTTDSEGKKRVGISDRWQQDFTAAVSGIYQYRNADSHQARSARRSQKPSQKHLSRDLKEFPKRLGMTCGNRTLRLENIRDIPPGLKNRNQVNLF